GSLGNNFWVDNIFFPGNVVVTSVAETKGENIPKVFELDQNYPNPFNPTTVIRYGLPHKASVTLTLYNTLGQKVAVLVNGSMEAGYHEVTLKGSHLASGPYFLRMEAGDFVQTRKMILMK
ncbi:MAG TPA: T9SS type A sorting domain-containing protein, partial [Bacteroidota bacterium]